MICCKGGANVFCSNRRSLFFICFLGLEVLWFTPQEDAILDTMARIKALNAGTATVAYWNTERT